MQQENRDFFYRLAKFVWVVLGVILGLSILYLGSSMIWTGISALFKK